MINPVKQYNLTPEQMANYKPGMDLGEPDRVYQPESLVKKDSIQPTIVSQNSRPRRVVGGKKKTFQLSKVEYLQLHLTGLSRDAVAERSNISLSRLQFYLRQWEIGKPDVEEALLKELGHG